MKSQKEQNKFDERIKKQYKPLIDGERLPILDGIIDISLYKKSHFKILWLLKDTNGFDENAEPNWNYRNAIYEATTNYEWFKNWNKTFTNIVYIAQMLHNNIQYDNLRFISGEHFKTATILNKQAYINLKKTPGAEKSKPYELNLYYNTYKQLLNDQISKIKPQVVICGSTFEYLDEYKIGLKLKKIKYGSILKSYFDEEKQLLFIDTSHPNLRGRRIKSKEYCEEIVRVIKKQIK